MKNLHLKNTNVKEEEFMIEKGMIISERYLIIDELYKKESKEIFKAYHLKLCIEVIIKKIYLNAKNILFNEDSILRAMKHQYIPQIYDLINYEEETYLVMEFVNGVGLDVVLKEKRVKTKNIEKWSIQILKALNYMHSQRVPVLHCDIKPSNIIIDLNDDANLIDFNISMVLNGFASPKGFSKHFAAPEIQNYFEKGKKAKIKNKGELKLKYKNQVRNSVYRDERETVILGESDRVKETCAYVKADFDYKYQLNSGSNYKIEKNAVDNRADIYSIGALMYFMYTGKYYDESENSEALKENHVDKKIIAIIEKSLEYFRDNRFENVSDMIGVLKK